VSRPSHLVLIGHPVDHSLSPVIQAAALEKAGIELAYELVDVTAAKLDATIDRAVEEGWAGNVTLPHKEAFLRRCGKLTPIAERAGAVNTFRVRNGLLMGHNTDVGGFDALVRRLHGGDLPVMPVVAVLGCGGAARAALAAMERWPDAKVRVWSRKKEDAVELAKVFERIAVPVATREEALEGATLVVNATSLGLKDSDAMPVPVEKVPAEATVVDCVYRPGGTAWVNGLRARGINAEDGLGMLVEQAALAFSWWFGAEPDREAMAAAVGLQPA
jgi:shikimate dehydrogenase